MKEMYSPQEVAKILDVHVKTVRRYLRDGTLMGQKVGGAWKIPASEIKKQLDVSLPTDFEKVQEVLSPSESHVRRCLIVEIDVKTTEEASKYAQAMMAVINSQDYKGCNFKFHLDQQVAKFILNGTSKYMVDMLAAIEEVEADED